MELLLGIDIGTSFIKASVVDAASGTCMASAAHGETESTIISKNPGWAEQDPDLWWNHVQDAVRKVIDLSKSDPKHIRAIGIAYQMHGLVMVDKEQRVLRDAIIWCDGRAVEIGNLACEKIGKENCLSTILNSPGNFTASKLAWVKEYEPGLFAQTDRFMLPGDFIAMKMTGEITTTPSALSESILWDFEKQHVSRDVMDLFGFDDALIPDIKPVFAQHGFLKADVAQALGMTPGIPVTYKAGDQLNNALSLNVMSPGELAVTAGTSGVIYAVTDQMFADPASRVNSFAHVNYNPLDMRLGVLLCINGCGIMNSWLKKLLGGEISYERMNALAATVQPGSDGLMILPFGNGPERMLENNTVGAHIVGLDFNRHSAAHMIRAAQEGVAFAFRYGLDILRENGLAPAMVRACKSNLFLSEVFIEAFVHATGLEVALYENESATGAAIGAGIGVGLFSASEALNRIQPVQHIKPATTLTAIYEERYQCWKKELVSLLDKQAIPVHTLDTLKTMNA